MKKLESGNLLLYSEKGVSPASIGPKIAATAKNLIIHSLIV